MTMTNNYIYNKEKTITLIKSLKERYGMRNKDWCKLLNIELDTYKNAIYHNVITVDTLITVYDSLNMLVKSKIIELSAEELALLVWKGDK